MRDKESGVAYVLWTFRRSNGVILHQEKMPGKMVDEKVPTNKLGKLIYLTTMALVELLDVLLGAVAVAWDDRRSVKVLVSGFHLGLFMFMCMVFSV